MRWFGRVFHFAKGIRRIVPHGIRSGVLGSARGLKPGPRECQNLTSNRGISDRTRHCTSISRGRSQPCGMQDFTLRFEAGLVAKEQITIDSALRGRSHLLEYRHAAPYQLRAGLAVFSPRLAGKGNSNVPSQISIRALAVVCHRAQVIGRKKASFWSP
ncbi:hypothetical protein C7212DRAFT_344746 [Tuber magnatum]|uniref:Uncharacterized protein n=1 Tax=Tuber magnatum TaxID=42249 RepID=A0A317SR52_9PEZI|nr:hypothetical protein C7212DRAFT_344746 [Tuber magnatum]